MKKTSIIPSGNIQKGPIVDEELRFSFKYYDDSDSELCPPLFHENYTQVLMRRLKNLSSMKMKEFTTQFSSRGSALRIHKHDWSETSRPQGFLHLPKHLAGSEGWQFQLTANEHGRVHGIIIGHTFYVIWLDKDHKLYP